MTSIEFETGLDLAVTALQPSAMQLTKNSEDTKDLMQITMMKAWVNKHRFMPGTNFKAWLYTIMKNTFLTDYQRKKRRQTYLDVTSNQYFLNSSSAYESISAETALNVQEIHSAIDSLPEQHRVPFSMFLQGYKYEEISLSLSLPLGTVKNRIFLARQKLKDQLAKLFQFSDS